MRQRIFKFALCVFLAFLCLFGAMRWTVRAKNSASGDAYRSAQETLRATELTQYITSLEFGLRYGKELDNYYNMDVVLQSILRSSPYVEGAYIVSNENALLYRAGEPMPNMEQMVVLHNGREALYASNEQFGYAFIFMDIFGGENEDERAGTLIVMLNNDILNRLVETYQQEGQTQSRVILLEAMLAAVLVLSTLLRKQKKFKPVAIAIALCVTVLAAQTVDMGIETVKLNTQIHNITSQSVQKIAQVLQQQVEGVMDKGVGTDEMYDVYGWLDDIDEKLDSVDRLDFTGEGKVRATLDESDVRRSTLRAVRTLAFHLALEAAACALLCVCTALGEKLVYLLIERKKAADAAWQPPA